MDLSDKFAWLGPLLSLLGAVISWYWAQKRMNWDAGKELGPLRVETIELFKKAVLLDNDTWRRERIDLFYKDFLRWEREVQECASLIPRQAYRMLNRASKDLRQALEETIGKPLGGLAAAEALTSQQYAQEYMADETRQRLFDVIERLSADRHFLSR